MLPLKRSIQIEFVKWQMKKGSQQSKKTPANKVSTVKSLDTHYTNGHTNFRKYHERIVYRVLLPMFALLLFLFETVSILSFDTLVF